MGTPISSYRTQAQLNRLGPIQVAVYGLRGLKLLLAKGYDLHGGSRGARLLHLVVWQYTKNRRAGRITYIKYLLSHGVKPMKKTLTLAAEQGCMSLHKILMG
jgi:hypothetical protein